MSTIDSDGALAAVQKHGAVLLRGASTSIDTFTRLSEVLMTPLAHHATNTIERDPVAGDPQTSTVNKGMDDIPLHREGSYAPFCPDMLMLYCEQPSQAGGETIICDGINLFHSLPPGIQSFVAELDLYWSWEAPPARWTRTLGTDDPSEAEDRLAKLSALLKPWEKFDGVFKGQTLHGRFKTRCAIPCPDKDRLAFCNSLMIYYYRAPSEYYARDLFRVTLEDGSEFPPDILSEISSISAQVCREISWKPGDILIVDNARVMHGRRRFDDPDRRVLIRMGHLKA